MANNVQVTSKTKAAVLILAMFGFSGLSDLSGHGGFYVLATASAIAAIISVVLAAITVTALLGLE